MALIAQGLFFVGTLDMRTRVRAGILFSRTGSYAAVGEAMLAGAMLAVDEVNADPQLAITIEPIARDPGGVIGRYVDGARDLVVNQRVSHVIGCYTSSSRKELLPLFEKHDALLWYPSHYEGFETSDNVVYTGAGPNQHVLPLARFFVERGARRGWFIGSNYIWAWENNRIMRESLLAAGGNVLGERYFAVGDTDLDSVVQQILDQRPDFVFNTLIGESAYSFYRMFRLAAEARGLNQPRDIPIASCSLAEPELAMISPTAASGHLSSSVYFSTVETPENARFTASWRRRYPELGRTSADAEASYVAVHLFARAVVAAGTADLQGVRGALRGLAYNAPQGRVCVDPENRHCYLRPRIGRSTAEGTFEIVYESAEAVRPDPYLVWDSVGTAAAAPHLRVIS